MQKIILLVASILSFGFIFNLAWELLQMPLYEGGNYLADHLTRSLYAVFWDTAIVVGIYLIIGLVRKNLFWLLAPDFFNMGLAIVIGLSLAVFIELRALREGRWGYSALMPIIPFTKIGLSPIIQMLVLPNLAYYLSGKFFKAIRR